MAAKLNYEGMAKELVASFDEKTRGVAARTVARRRSQFSLASIERSNLRPAVRKVVEELVTGKLPRANKGLFGRTV